MNPEAIIAELRRINAWRRGDETVGQPAPGHFGDVLDAAAESLRSLIASNTTLRSEARAELKQRKADVTRMEEYLRNSGRNMDEAQEQIAERDARVADLSAALARVTAERDAAKAEALGNAASYRDADARRAENYRMITTVQCERDVAKRDIVALRARVTEVEVQAERYRLATLRQDADLARVTAERDHAQGITENLPNVSVPQPCQMRAELAEASLKVAREQISALRARVAELETAKAGITDALTRTANSEHMIQQRNAELKNQNELLIQDRSRFPDKSCEVGNIIAAHVENLKATADSNAEAWRWACVRESALRQRNADLVAALRLALGALEARGVSVKDAPKNSQIAHWYALARAESATPAKHPDTEIVDWLDAQFQGGDDWCRLFPLGNTIREAYAARKQGGEK